MTDIIIQGIGGRMGHVLCELIAQREDCRVIAGIDVKDGEQNGIPVYDSLDKLEGKGDVIIDFSSPAAVEKALPYCEAHKLPIVVCTTGLSEELQLKVVQLSRSIPVFKSANMSMGINVLSELCWQTQSMRRTMALTTTSMTVPLCARSVTRKRSASARCAAAASWATTRYCSAARTKSSPSNTPPIPAIFLQMEPSMQLFILRKRSRGCTI